MSTLDPRSLITRAPEALEEASARLTTWLVEKAFPLWWEAGADTAGGGFHDRLDDRGRPVPGPKRARVVARQVFCYAHAEALGWGGPWRAAMAHGSRFLRASHRREDGLYRAFAATAADEGADERTELYDQAFVLLALAHQFGHGDADAEPAARALVERLAPHPLGGFREIEGAALFSNPNMHLFEAFLAWAEAGGEPSWRALAQRQADLARRRLIDDDTGAIFETYDQDWRAEPERERWEVWPGHQFEWAWLLLRHARLTGDESGVAPALRLIALAEGAGVDRGRSVAVDGLDGTLTVREAGARLWPQTERLKATLGAARITGEAAWWAAAEDAAKGMESYLDPSGLWRDRLDAQGRFVAEPSPASSFYHLVGAILELNEATGSRPRRSLGARSPAPSTASRSPSAKGGG